jgi:lipase
VGEWEAIGGHRDSSSLPVLAVHGVTSMHPAWMWVADRLPARRVLAPDLRGRGHSNALPGPFGMRAHADDLATVLDAAGVERAVVVGHSMGAFVTAAFLQHHPDRVAGAVLVDGGLPIPLPAGLSVEEAMDAVLGPAAQRLGMTFRDHAAYREFWRQHPAFAHGWDDALESYLDYDLQGEPPSMTARTTYEAMAEDSRDMFTSGGVQQAAERLPAGTVFLRAPRGLLDQVPPLYPDALVEEWQQRLPGLSVSTVPGVNHYTVVIGAGAPVVAAAVEEVASAAG